MASLSMAWDESATPLVQLQLASRPASPGGSPWGGSTAGWKSWSHSASVLCCLVAVPKCHCHQGRCDQATWSHAMIGPLIGTAFVDRYVRVLRPRAQGRGVLRRAGWMQGCCRPPPPPQPPPPAEALERPEERTPTGEEDQRPPPATSEWGWVRPGLHVPTQGNSLGTGTSGTGKRKPSGGRFPPW